LNIDHLLAPKESFGPAGKVENGVFISSLLLLHLYTSKDLVKFTNNLKIDG
jgi:hypothetical protein